MAPSYWIAKFEDKIVCCFSKTDEFIKVLTDGGFVDRFVEVNKLGSNDLKAEFKKYTQKVNRIKSENNKLEVSKPLPPNLKFHNLVKISKVDKIEDFERGSQDSAHLNELIAGLFEGKLCESDNKKACETCKERLDLDKFSVEKGIRRAVCNSCRNKKQVEKKVIALEGIADKECNGCKVSKPIGDFEKDRNICKSCRYKQKVSANVGKIPDSGVPCRECSKEFKAEEFKYCTDKGKYDSICKECYNSKKHYEKHREKKRAEDEEEYLKHNAEVHRDYTKKHPDVIAKNTEKQATVPDSKMKTIRNSSKSRGIYFNEEDYEIMKQKLSLPCYYCNEEVNGILQGLDRLNNDKGYYDLNTVPCCTICNHLKGSIDINTFFEKISLIANNSNLDMEETKKRVENDKTAGGGKIDTSRKVIKRMIHHPEIQGIRVSFYNKDTGNVAFIANTIKEASEMTGISDKTGNAKLKGLNNIWVKPNWLARRHIEGDVIVETETQTFMKDLDTVQRYEKKLMQYVNFNLELANGKIVHFKNATQLATYLQMPSKTVNNWLNSHRYKEKDTEIALCDNWDGCKIITKLV